jgi:hypothetical protein
MSSLKVLANAVNERVDLCIQSLESNEDTDPYLSADFLMAAAINASAGRYFFT